MGGSNSRDFVVNILADGTQALAEMEGFASKAGKIAGGIGAAWSAIELSGALAEGFTAGALRDQVTRELEGALGTGTEAARQAGESSADLWAQGFGESFDELAAAVQAVTQNLDGEDLGGAALERLTVNAMNLSKVMGEDVTRTTAAAASMIRSGLAANADEAFDIILKGSQLGVNKAEDLIDTMEEYSVQFVQLGLTSQQALGLMNQGLEGGARNADVVADALKEFGIRAQEAMVEAADSSAVEAAQQRVADAHRASAQAIEAAQERIASAEQNLTRAQEDQRRAQQGLTEARREAKLALEEMAEQLEDAALSERGAELAVQRAQRNLLDAQTDKDYDQLAVDEAQLALDRANDALDDQRKRTADLKAEKAAADAAGVRGSEQVKAARDAVTQADRAALQAQRDVAAAQREASQVAADGARQIAQAVAALADVSTPKLTAMGQAYAALGLDGEEIGARVAQGGEAAKGALDEVLDALRNVEDPATRAQLAVQLFGTKSEDMQKALYNLDVSTATEGIDDVAGGVDRLSDNIADGLVSQQAAAERSTQGWQDALTDLPGPLGDVSKQLFIWGPALSGIVSTLGPLATGLMAWKTAQAASVAPTVAATAANTGFAASMWASAAPILAVVAAVAAVALGAYLLIKNWDKVSAFFGTVWDGIKVGAEWVLDFFKDHWLDAVLLIVTGPFGLAVKWIVTHWDTVKGWFGAFVGWLGDKLSDVGGVLLAPFRWGLNKVGGWVDWVTGKLGSMVDFITGMPGRVKDGLLGLMRLWAGVVNFLIDGWNQLDIKIGPLSIPDWVPLIGGRKWQVDDVIPDIPFRINVPKLAQGGITDGPTLALIGDNPGGRELVMPLPPGADPSRLMSPFGGRATVVVPLVVDGRELARTVHEVDLREGWGR